MNFNELATIIESTHVELQQRAVKAVNQFQTVRNWLIGFYIVEFEQEGEDRAGYGEQLLMNLERRVNQKGLNVTLFQRARSFYSMYPQFAGFIKPVLCSIPALLIEGTREGSGSIYASLMHKLVATEATGKCASVMPKSEAGGAIEGLDAKKLLFSISFTHFIELMKIGDPVKRLYYEMLTIQTGLSVRELKRQIATLNYERVGLSCDVENAIEAIKQKIHPQVASDAVKSEYFLDFLGVPQQRSALLKENELETLLLDNLQAFILELGNGFCFEARQKRILIGGEYFFIDIVFYHRILKAHVLVELKVDEFDHSHASQLNTYLNYYQEEVMEPGDNPPIGILLVTDKNDALVKYATAGMDEKIFVSKYRLQLPTEKQLQDLIMKNIKEN